MKKILLAAMFFSSYAFADACPKEGAAAIVGGYAQTSSGKEPVAGVSLTYGNYCLGLGGLRLSFGAELDYEKLLKKKQESVAAGPAWCLLLPTGTDACLAYLVRSTTLRDDAGKYNVGDVGPSYAVRQNVGAFQVSASAHYSPDDKEHPTFLLGLGYTPAKK
jgi:hypothetical protein